MWELALLSSAQVQHLATKAHYIIHQSENRRREKNNAIAPKAGSGHHLKNHLYVIRSVDKTKAVSNIITERATWPSQKQSGTAQKAALSFRCISEYELISMRLSKKQLDSLLAVLNVKARSPRLRK